MQPYMHVLQLVFDFTDYKMLAIRTYIGVYEMKYEK